MLKLRAVVITSLITVGWQMPMAFAEKVKPIIIETKEDSRIANGTFADLAGEADENGPLMALQDLTLFHPVQVTVISSDSTAPLHVKISKPGGTDIIFEADTNENGSATAKFRSQDEAQILVTSPTGRKPFTIQVWVAGVIPPKMQSVLRPIP